MSALSDLADALRILPARSLQSAAGTRTSHSVGDLLDLLDRAGEDQVKQSRKLPIRLAQIRPGGTVNG